MALDDPAVAHAACADALAAGVAEALLALIGPAIGPALVVDAACGGGLLAERLAAAGYAVQGGDPSAELVAMARLRVGEGRFLRATLATVDLPPARAIVATGEAIGRQVAPRDRAMLAAFVARAHAALERGGILLLDAGAPGRTGGGFVTGRGWAAGSESRLADPATLERTTTLFLDAGTGWQRHHLRETLSLWPPAEMIDLLRTAGFTVEAGDRHGALRLPPGLIRYTAQK